MIDPCFTSLLAHFDESSGTAWVDSGPWKRAGAVIGAGSVASTTQSKFGGASRYFQSPNTSSYLQVAYNSSTDRFLSDFTVAAWVYPEIRDATYDVIASRGGDSNTGWTFAIYPTSGELYFDIGTGSALLTLLGGTVALNAWSHVVACRLGGTISLYVNGAKVAETTNMQEEVIEAISADHFTRIGRGRGSSANYFRGYVDDVLIHNECIYSDSFSVPTEPYTLQPYTATTIGTMEEYEPIPYEQYAQEIGYFNLLDKAAYHRSERYSTNYTLEGSLHVQGVNSSRQVTLYKEESSHTSLDRGAGLFDAVELTKVATVESSPPIGSWKFEWLDPLASYTVIAHDRDGTYNPIIRSGLRANSS